MHALREVLNQAAGKHVAVGHFNIADLVQIKGVFTSARELNIPALVGVSEGERDLLAKAIEAAKAGFDSIVFDVSTLPFEENIRQTKQAVEALRVHSSRHGYRRRNRRHRQRLGDSRRSGGAVRRADHS